MPECSLIRPGCCSYAVWLEHKQVWCEREGSWGGWGEGRGQGAEGGRGMWGRGLVAGGPGRFGTYMCCQGPMHVPQECEGDHCHTTPRGNLTSSCPFCTHATPNPWPTTGRGQPFGA
eukprot:351159-Chlamydomonas_euryale.AAC.8